MFRLRSMLGLLLLFATIPLFSQNAKFIRKVVNIDDGKITNIGDIGDLNEDGVPDLVSFSGGGYQQPPRALYVLLSNGSASYNSTPFSYSATPGYGKPFVVDVNNDGHLDVVGSDSANIYVYLGNGSGSLSAPLSQPANAVVQAKGDFNNDGKVDLVTFGYVESLNRYQLSMYLGNGDGTFSPGPVVFDLFAEDLRAGDFDGDGNDDLVGEQVTTFEGGAVFSPVFLYGDGTGHFTEVDDSHSYRDGRISAVADLNKDGRSDVLGYFYDHPGYPRPDISKGFVAYGSPTHTPAHASFDQAGFSELPAGDFDNDGDLDLGLSGYRIHNRAADGSYGPVSTYYSSSSINGDPLAADFNKDGKADLLVPISDSQYTSIVSLEIFLNLSSGSGCAAPSSVSVVICDPADGSTVDSPLRLRATAKLSTSVSRFEVWDNNAKIFTGRDTSTIDTNANLAPGDHLLSFVARSASGERTEKTIKITVAASSTNCQAPASNGIVVCEPAPYADVPSTFHVKALARTGGTYRFELWAGGNKLVTVRDSGTLDTNVTLAPGTYLMHFIARRRDGVRYTKDQYVFVH